MCAPVWDGTPQSRRDGLFPTPSVPCVVPVHSSGVRRLCSKSKMLPVRQELTLITSPHDRRHCRRQQPLQDGSLARKESLNRSCRASSIRKSLLRAYDNNRYPCLLALVVFVLVRDPWLIPWSETCTKHCVSFSEDAEVA